MSLTLTLERVGGEVSGSGTNIELDGTIAGGAIKSVEMYGDTEQTTYSGKNLIGLVDGTYTKNSVVAVVKDGVITLSGTSDGTGDMYIPYIKTPLTLAAGTYTHSYSRVPSGRFPMNAALGYAFNIGWNGEPSTATINSETSYGNSYRIQISENNNYNGVVIKPQLEIGSTATSFEPYVGGTASPNPDYPQEVQTVTGEQTVTISDGNGQSQSYSINLGDIELCKIGDYQDYIYKSGEDWYVHKEIGKLLADVASGYIGSGDNYTNISYFVFDMAPDAKYYNQYSNNLDYKCTHATPKVHTSGSTWDTSALIGGISMDAAPTKYWLGFQKGTTLADMKSYLSGMLVYYPLATPTDTQITDATLIAQLEALNAGETYDGTTLITVSSENLAGPLEVKASSNIEKTYTEVEIGSPFTIADVEGKSSNTTLDGNVYVDWAYNKKQYSFDLFNLTPQDYADIRAFYDYQFNNSAFPTITVPELNIDKLPVYMEISSRNIINQCLLTDKLTIKFRETVQP